MDGDATDDPARRFLDQTVPRDDAWDGREPEEGPARPRHVQHPTPPVSSPPPDPRERRRTTIRNAAWTFGPTLGYLAANAALSDDGAQADSAPDPDPPSYDDQGGGYGEIGSGL